ncbi:MAG: hypothetical protein ABII89_08135 [Candidatus Omnitrophota bacterium]
MDKNLLAEFFEKQTIPLWGVTGLTKNDSVFLPKDLQGHFASAVVYAFPLSNAVLDLLSEGPDLLYLHHYRQVNYLLDRVGTLASELLRQNGFSGLPVPASQVIDWKEQKGLLSLRQLALNAGLGWIGRNNLLVTPDFGSRVRLSAVLTDAPLDAGKLISFGCGECTRCLSRCPVSAIKTEPDNFDLTVCREFIKDTCSRKGIGQNICGLCLCSAKDRSLNGNA